MTDTKKLNIDVEGAKRQAKESAGVDRELRDTRGLVERDARWRQLFTASLEGAAVGLLDELEEDDDERVEGDEPEDTMEQMKERAALTAAAAAFLADAALQIEINRGVTP